MSHALISKLFQRVCIAHKYHFRIQPQKYNTSLYVERNLVWRIRVGRAWLEVMESVEDRLFVKKQNISLWFQECQSRNAKLLITRSNSCNSPTFDEFLYSNIVDDYFYYWRFRSKLHLFPFNHNLVPIFLARPSHDALILIHVICWESLHLFDWLH